MDMENKKLGVRKGAWTKEEDTLLRDCIDKFGEGKWHKVPLRAGLNRCRKSCRLRWLNYLRPNLKRGYFNKDEVDLVLRLHKLLGNRWSLIAGRLPGRTANDVKNFWNTHIMKKSTPQKNSREKIMEETKTLTQKNTIIYKPRPRTFSKSHVPAAAAAAAVGSSDDANKTNQTKYHHDHIDNKTPEDDDNDDGINTTEFPLSEQEVDKCIRWWLETTGERSLPGDGETMLQPVFSPGQINENIMEFSSVAVDGDVWDLSSFD